MNENSEKKNEKEFRKEEWKEIHKKVNGIHNKE